MVSRQLATHEAKPSSSEHQHIPHGDDNLPHNDILHKASQAEVVRALTRSNHETFECLKVFCEKYKEKRTFMHSHSKKKIYKHVVEQAGIYVSTIDVSLRVAERGMSISRDATSAFEDGTLPPEVIVGPMIERTEEALKDVMDISSRFRGIRVALFHEMQRLSPGSSLQIYDMNEELGKRHKLEIEELRSMDDNDLLKLTLAVLDQFVSIVGDFVDWWSSLQVDVDRLSAGIRFIRKNPDISGQVHKQWQNMEQHYKTYRSEIMAQQDYYNRALKDLMPKSFIHRVARRLGFE